MKDRTAQQTKLGDRLAATAERFEKLHQLLSEIEPPLNRLIELLAPVRTPANIRGPRGATKIDEAPPTAGAPSLTLKAAVLQAFQQLPPGAHTVQELTRFVQASGYRGGRKALSSRVAHACRVDLPIVVHVARGMYSLRSSQGAAS